MAEAAMGQTGYEAESEAAPKQSYPEHARQSKPVAKAPVVEEELGAIEVSEEHANFQLDKRHDDDTTIGTTNQRHILCQFCEIILVPEGNATKVRHEVDQIESTQREFHRCNAYWYVPSLTYFLNIEVHQLEAGLKYLCCLSCQSAILGYQIINRPDQIYIACDRVKEEI